MNTCCYTGGEAGQAGQVGSLSFLVDVGCVCCSRGGICMQRAMELCSTMSQGRLRQCALAGCRYNNDMICSAHISTLLGVQGANQGRSNYGQVSCSRTQAL